MVGSVQFTKSYSNIIFGIIFILCFMPFMSPAIALALGILLSLLGVKNNNATKYVSLSLKSSIVLLGFGMNLTQVIAASRTGFLETAISVVFVMTTGIVLTKLFKVDFKTGLLISTGTAICGGSAIAAVSPVVDAETSQISFSLIVVFSLNAIALMIFPPIGHYLNMSQEMFGNWAAIAIHDTSSVVGAGATYGAKALEVATTVKLIRALWIIPLSLVIALFQKGKSSKDVKIPWFIALFVVAIIIAYLFPENASVYSDLSWIGKKGMIIALFLIGANISFSDVKKAGFKSFMLGVGLWLIIGISSLVMLKLNL